LDRGREDRLGWFLIWQIITWTIWKFRNDVFFSEGTFSVECLIDRVKLLSWKWFLGKNLDSHVPFMSGVSILLYAGTDRVLLGCRFWVSMGQEDWWPSGYVVLPAVDPCLSLHMRYSSFRGGTLDDFSLFGVCIIYFL
jgi:hypothetical protein